MGRPKLTFQDVKQRFTNKNLELLCDNYVDARTNMPYRCLICQYEGTTSIAIIKQNRSGCKKCGEIRHKDSVSRKRLTIDNVREIFSSKGLTLNQFNYASNTQKLKYTCDTCGYNGETCVTSVKANDGCFKCGVVKRKDSQKLSFLEVKSRFDQQGLILLEDNYIREDIKMKYRCKKCNTEDQKSIASLSAGTGCRTCGYESALKKRKLSQQFVEEFFKLCRCKLLSEYTNNKSKLTFICHCGKTYEISCFTSFVTAKQCLTCGKTKAAYNAWETKRLNNKLMENADFDFLQEQLEKKIRKFS